MVEQSHRMAKRCSIPLAQFPDSIRETGRRFLRHVVPDTLQYATVVEPDELSGLLVIRWRRVDAIVRAQNYDGRSGNIGFACQSLFDFCISWIACNDAITMPIGMDYDIDEVRIVESGRASLECGVIEGPGW
ncbi:hypothetical protein AB9E06_33930 [Rhizobium leguminosarum]|uniref:hypothetical protein n=1 Tax=Rhizobium leguminosarum TaxID=384 RepID=UPI003F984C30